MWEMNNLIEYHVVGMSGGTMISRDENNKSAYFSVVKLKA